MRLIDADEMLANESEAYMAVQTREDVSPITQGINSVVHRKMQQLIADTPTVEDAVVVVRCKNCRWWNEAGCAIHIVDETDKPRENDFCSFGERVTDNATD